MEQYASILTAILGLLTAWFSYKAAVKKTVSKLRDQTAVAYVKDTSIKHDYWKPRKFVFVIVIIQFLWFVIISLLSGFDLLFLKSFLIGALIGIGFLLIMLRFLRKEPPSRVMKSITIKLKEKPVSLASKCIEAINQMGAKVSLIDEKKGKIEAKKPFSFWSFGDIIDINIEEESPGITSVKISSDSVMPTVLFDFGHNARNVRKIKDYLLGL